MRNLVLMLLAAPLCAAPPSIAKFDPTELPRQQEKELRAEAKRRAKQNFGKLAADYESEYYRKVALPVKQARITEVVAAAQARIVSEGTPDHSTATEKLCRLYGTYEERGNEIQLRREELTRKLEKLLTAPLGTPGARYKDGAKGAALELEANRRLLREFSDALRGLRVECVALLAKKREADSVAYLERKALVAGKQPGLRAQVASVLARHPAATATTFLRPLKSERDPSVRAALVLSLGQLGERAHDAIPLIAAALDDPSERVRVATARALAKLRTADAVEPLVQRIGKESGRALFDFARALEALTGERHGTHPKAWQSWWKGHRTEILEKGLPAPGAGKESSDWKGEGGHFYGIPQVSQRVIYVIDVSDSMKYTEGGATRLDRCKSEVKATIGKLPRNATFTVIAYHSEVKPWERKMVRATPGHKRSAHGWIDELRFFGSTNIYDALRVAFEIAAGGASAKATAPRLADTIYLLSDGAPTTPDAELDDIGRILDAVREWNVRGHITIHTIGIGKNLKFTFLKELAKAHGGEFIRKDW